MSGKDINPRFSVDEPVDTSSPKVLPDISNVKVEPKKSGRTHCDYTDKPIDLPDPSYEIDTEELTSQSPFIRWCARGPNVHHQTIDRNQSLLDWIHAHVRAFKR